MKKQVLSFALVMVMALGLAAPALAAGKLSTPTGLGHQGRLYTLTWNRGENYTGIVRVGIYKDDCLLIQAEFDDFSTSATSSSADLSVFLAENDISLDSGVYYYTVQNIVDFGSSSEDNSDVATSAQWNYVKPDVQLAPPVDPAWDFPYHVWRRGVDVELQQAVLQLCFCESENGDYQTVSNSYCDIGRDAVRLPMDTWALEEYGAGYYKFRIMNLSDDLNQSQNSLWSPYSEPCYYDGSPVDICNHPNYVYEADREATCTEPGQRGNAICADCGEVIWYGSSIPALGHDLDADGICRRCGEHTGHCGTLGENAELTWAYAAETGLVTFDGAIPDGETVFVARYQNGRFIDVKAVDHDTHTADVGAGAELLRFFWLSARQTPKCPAGSLSLKP